MGKRAILVQRRMGHEPLLLYELRELAEAAGYEVVGELVQVRAPDSSFHLGRGKVRELATLVRNLNADKVIFHNELRPVQSYNLQKELKIEVIDRFELILEIFAQRAGSKEAKLQIELARLKRELSFIKEWIHLTKTGELHGFMGGGRYAVDAYYRHAVKKIAFIEAELRRVRKNKEARWRGRREAGLYSLSLAGYTGAGKTTLFRALTGHSGYIDGKPFATLSTKTRRSMILGRPMLISDTIGFIDSLPPLLVDAFYTTLGEMMHSDLIILVVDVSEEEGEIRRKLEASLETLSAVGVHSSKLIVAANKIDKLTSGEVAKRAMWIADHGLRVVPVSALKGRGIGRLKEEIVRDLPDYMRLELDIDSSNTKILKIVENNCYIRSIEKNDGAFRVVVEGKRDWITRLASIIGKSGAS